MSRRKRDNGRKVWTVEELIVEMTMARMEGRNALHFGRVAVRGFQCDFAIINIGNSTIADTNSAFAHVQNVKQLAKQLSRTRRVKCYLENLDFSDTRLTFRPFSWELP